MTLSNLLRSPLLGCIAPVTLGDALASKLGNKRGRPKKVVLERQSAPTFQTIIEMVENRRWKIYRDVGHIVDQILLGQRPIIEESWQLEDGAIYSRFNKLALTKEEENWLDMLKN